MSEGVYSMFHQKINKHLIFHYTQNLNAEFIQLLIDDPKNKILFYNIEGKLQDENNIGCIICRKSKEKMYLLLIAIHPDFSNIGYGTLLMHEFCDYCKNLHIESIILHSTQENQEFYEKLGFTICEKHYLYRIIYQYENYHKNDIIMKKSIT